jgi:hypothetical protein
VTSDQAFRSLREVDPRVVVEGEVPAVLRPLNFTGSGWCKLMFRG